MPTFAHHFGRTLFEWCVNFASLAQLARARDL